MHDIDQSFILCHFEVPKSDPLLQAHDKEHRFAILLTRAHLLLPLEQIR